MSRDVIPGLRFFSKWKRENGKLEPVRCGCGGKAEAYAWVTGSYSVHCLSCGIETVNCKTEALPEEKEIVIGGGGEE